MSKNTAPHLVFNRYGKVSVAATSVNNTLYANPLTNGNVLVVTADTHISWYIAHPLSGFVTYNTNGTVSSHFSVKDPGLVFGEINIALQVDGKILMAGTLDDYISFTRPTSPADFYIFRYNPDGSLDKGFSGDGKTITNLGTYDYAHAVTVQTDKKILVVGSSDDDFALVRYNPNGALDTGFSGDGKVKTTLGLTSDDSGNPDKDSGNAVAVQADGKILVAGASIKEGTDNSNFALLRYNANGSLDTGFSGDGKVITDLGSSDDTATAVIVQANGKILVSGSSHGKLYLVRYNANGSLDTGFSGDGKVTTDLNTYNLPHTVSVQADGKILLAGINSNEKFTLERYNSNGTLDMGFSGDGKVITTESVDNISVQADGKILVFSNDTIVNSLSRYNTDGSIDQTFGQTDSLTVYQQNTPAVILNSGAQVFDAELNARGNYNGASVSLLRHGGLNHQDIFSGSGSLNFVGDKAILSGLDIGTVSNIAKA